MAVVGKEGLEPTRLSAPDPKSGSSTNSDTSPLAVKYTVAIIRKLDNSGISVILSTVMQALFGLKMESHNR